MDCSLVNRTARFPPPLQLLYPATLSPGAAALAAVSQAATFALPASQLFVAAEDRGRVLRDMKVSGLWRSRREGTVCVVWDGGGQSQGVPIIGLRILAWA